MRAKRDGQPIPGTEGRITAAEQAAALGMDKTEPKPAPLPLTPAQQRRRMNNEWVDDDLDPPDYERSVVDDPSTIANVLGLRPDDFDAVPLGSAPEGQPIPQPGIRPKIEPRPDREPSTAAKTVTTPPPSPPVDLAARAALAADFRAHAAKVAELAESARGSGDAEREAKAAAEVAASRQVGEQLKARGIL